MHCFDLPACFACFACFDCFDLSVLPVLPVFLYRYNIIMSTKKKKNKLKLELTLEMWNDNATARYNSEIITKLDANTQDFISRIPDLSLDKVREKVSNISVMHDEVSIEMINDIFNQIKHVFYYDLFDRYLSSQGKRFEIVFDESAAEVGSFIDTQDDDVDTSLIKFIVKIRALQQIPVGTLFYSGGYLTNNIIHFIIFMLLHESIHVIEFADEYLKTSADHSNFFYVTAYRWFKIISKMSNTVTKSNSIIDYNVRDRIYGVLGIKDGILTLMWNPSIPVELTDDGEQRLQDYYNLTDGTVLGYIAYLDKTGMGASIRRRRSRRRRTRKRYMKK